MRDDNRNLRPLRIIFAMLVLGKYYRVLRYSSAQEKLFYNVQTPGQCVSRCEFPVLLE